jgi:hypothetical protein
MEAERDRHRVVARRVTVGGDRQRRPRERRLEVDPVREREGGDQRVVRGEVERRRASPGRVGPWRSTRQPSTPESRPCMASPLSSRAQRRRVRVDHDLPAGERRSAGATAGSPTVQRNGMPIVLRCATYASTPAALTEQLLAAWRSEHPTIPAPGTKSPRAPGPERDAIS